MTVWTKKQQVMSLSTAESELYDAVKTASEGLGIQSVAKDLGTVRGLNENLDATATMCLVSRRGLGKAKHVDMQHRRLVTKNVGTNVNPADLMTKPLLGPKIDQLMKIMGLEFVGAIWSEQDYSVQSVLRRRKCQRLLDSEKFVSEMLKQSSRSGFDMCPRRSLDM